MRHRFLLAAPIPALAVVAVGAAGIALERGSLPPIAFIGVTMVGAAVAVAVVLRLRTSVEAGVETISGDVARLAREVADGRQAGAAMLPPSDDQFDPLVRSINALAAETETATADRVRAELEPQFADSTADVKEALAGIVVDLARRNQTLLDRQVEFIDRLEHGESDPDRLAELFKVDHLATRMRRNAESLLVLADTDPAKRRGDPVDIGEVLRVAVGEIENYQHVEFESVEGGLVGPAVAFDLAHLMAELMENATQFSPPDESVLVSGLSNGDGTYTIKVIDRGMGMPDDHLAKANRTLADPPELSLEMGRSLGFAVVARLADRLGAGVTLTPTAGGGVTASVAFPCRLFIDAPDRATPASTAPSTAIPAAASTGSANGRVEPAAAAAEAHDAGPSVPSRDPEKAPKMPVVVVRTDNEPFERDDRGSESAPSDPFSMFGGATPAFEASPPANSPSNDSPSNDSPSNDSPSNDSPSKDDLASDEDDDPLAWPMSAPADHQPDEPTPAPPTVGGPPSDAPSTAPATTPVTSPIPTPAPDHAPTPAPTALPAAAEAPSISPTSMPSPAPAANPGPATLRPSPTTVLDWPPPDASTLVSPPAWTPPAPPARENRRAEDRATAQPADGHPDDRRANDGPVNDAAAHDGTTNRVESLDRAAEDPASADLGNDGDHLGDEGAATAGGLKRRTRGASRIPIGEGRPVAASSRTPAEIHSMLSRYRTGLQTGKQAAQDPNGDGAAAREPGADGGATP